MQQHDKIFYGITPSEHRKYLKVLFQWAIENKPNICITTCGEFHLVKTAIDAGYKKENIVCSDISLYSSILGYYYTSQPIDSLGIKVNAPFDKKYAKCKTDVEKVATLLLIMKVQQLKATIHYENIIRQELLDNWSKHIKTLCTSLSDAKPVYEGITFQIRDLREEITDPKYDDSWLWTTDPPMYSGDYQKMFDFKDAIEWNNGIEEFDLKKEYMNLFELSQKQKHLALWLKYKDLTGIDENYVIYALEQSDRYDYWLTTKPKYFEKFPWKNYIKYKKETEIERYKNLRLMNDSDEIKPDSKVRFVSVSKEVALYYRDLLCHRLGTTAAEHYFLILIDGKIFSIVGLHVANVLRLKTDKFYEVFGMTANMKKYPRSTRLMMYFLTSKEMRDVLIPHISQVNRVYQLNGVKSTSFTRYGRDKTNANLLKKVSKEKQDDGYYKIQYESDFYPRNFQQSIKEFLAEEANNEK